MIESQVIDFIVTKTLPEHQKQILSGHLWSG